MKLLILSLEGYRANNSLLAESDNVLGISKYKQLILLVSAERRVSTTVPHQIYQGPKMN